MTADPPITFEDYVARRGADLERYAYVLTADRTAAQDLVQTALLKALRRWRSIAQMDEPHAYVRRIVTTCYLDDRRRRARRPAEHLTACPPDSAGPRRSGRGLPRTSTRSSEPSRRSAGSSGRSSCCAT